MNTHKILPRAIAATLATAALGLPGLAGAQTCASDALRLSEILFAPAEGGSAFVELENTGEAADIRGVTIDTGNGTVTVPVGLAELMKPTDRLLFLFDGGDTDDLSFADDALAVIHAPAANAPGNPVGHTALFRTSLSQNAESMLDYMAWGGPPAGTLSTTALHAGLWPEENHFFPSSPDARVVGPAVPVATYISTGDSLGRGSGSMWRRFLSAAVTPGAPNSTTSEVPVIAFPAPGEKTITPPSRMFWSTVPDAASYLVEITTGADFSAPEISAEVEESKYYPDPALGVGSYRWRVRAKSTDDSLTGWSAEATFEIVAPPADSGIEELDGTEDKSSAKGDKGGVATGNLIVIVLDSRSANGLQGATVTVNGSNSNTDATGTANFAAVPAGRRSVAVSLTNYQGRTVATNVAAIGPNLAIVTLTGNSRTLTAASNPARRQTSMLVVSRGSRNFGGCNGVVQVPRTGTIRWDTPRATNPNISCREPEYMWCWAVAARTIANFYTGTVTQDEVVLHVKKDLAWSGAFPAERVNAMTYAMNGNAPITNYAKPTAAQVKTWLDANRPLYFSFGWAGGGGHTTTIGGYHYQDKQFHIRILNWDNDGTIQTQSWATLGGNTFWEILLAPTGKTGRNTAASLSVDSDSDGINNFDEITRFPAYYTWKGAGGSTSSTKKDSDEDSIEDKNEIASWVFRNPGNASGPNPDPDNDDLYPEADKDSDNGGLEDGEEDLDKDGILDPPPAGATIANTETDILLKSDDKLIDLAFVIDTTGSMGPYINDVKANATAITNRLSEKFKSARVAVVQYRDHPPQDSLPYGAVSRFSTDKASTISAVNSLSPSGGGDGPESLFTAIINTVNGVNLADGDGNVWRPSSNSNVKRAIVYMTDAPAQNPDLVTGYTAADAIFALLRGGITIGDPTKAAGDKKGDKGDVTLLSGPIDVFPVIVTSSSSVLATAEALVDGAAGAVVNPSSASQVAEEILNIIDDISTAPTVSLVVSTPSGSSRITGQTTIDVDLSGSVDPDGCGIVLYEIDWDADGTYDESSPAPLFTRDFPGGFGGALKARVTNLAGRSSAASFLEEITDILPTLPLPDDLPAMTLNRQTGLLEQEVTVTNNEPAASTGFLILVTGIPDGTTLHNRSGTTDDGVPFVRVSGAIDPGDSLDLNLEFFSPSLATFTPTLSIVPDDSAPPSSDGVAFGVSRFLILEGSGDVLLEFGATPGHQYVIQYTNDGGFNWIDATVPLTAVNSRVQWIDNGPPKTSVHPSEARSRIYRVVRVSP